MATALLLPGCAQLRDGKDYAERQIKAGSDFAVAQYDLVRRKLAPAPMPAPAPAPIPAPAPAPMPVPVAVAAPVAIQPAVPPPPVAVPVVPKVTPAAEPPPAKPLPAPRAPAPVATELPPAAAPPPVPEPPKPVQVAVVWRDANAVHAEHPDLAITASRNADAAVLDLPLRVALTVRPSGAVAASEPVTLHLPANATAVQVPVVLPSVPIGAEDNVLAVDIEVQSPDTATRIVSAHTDLAFPSKEANAFAAAAATDEPGRLTALVKYLGDFTSGTHRGQALDLTATLLESGPDDRCGSDPVETLARAGTKFPAGHAGAQSALLARTDYDQLQGRLEALKKAADPSAGRHLYVDSRRFVDQHPKSACAALLRPWLAEAFWVGLGSSPQALTALAEYYLEQQRTQSALQTLKPAVAQGHVPAMVITGMLLLDKGDSAQAETVLSAAAAAHPATDPFHDVGMANYQLGVIAARHNQMQEAIRYFSAAIASDPSCARCYLERGQIYITAAHGADAQADFQKAVDTSARDPGRWPGVHEGAARLLADHSAN